VTGRHETPRRDRLSRSPSVSLGPGLASPAWRPAGEHQPGGITADDRQREEHSLDEVARIVIKVKWFTRRRAPQSDHG